MFGHKRTDEDIERLFSGIPPEDQELARLAPLTDLLRRSADQRLTEAETGRVAAEAARVAKRAAGEEPAGSGVRVPAAPSTTRRTRVTRRGRLAPRLAGALTIVLLLTSFTGVAFAADDAVPGDTLYGFDRAIERIGMNDGGLRERLTEADALASRGQVDDGLAHATEALAEQSGTDAAADQAHAALLGAANALANCASGDVPHLRARVAEMLKWMAGTETTGEEFARGVMAKASEIRGHAGDPDGEQTGAGSGDDPNNQPGPGQEAPGGQTATTGAGQGGTPAGQQTNPSGGQAGGSSSTLTTQSTTTTTNFTGSGSSPTSTATPGATTSSTQSHGGQDDPSGSGPGATSPSTGRP